MSEVSSCLPHGRSAEELPSEHEHETDRNVEPVLLPVAQTERYLNPVLDNAQGARQMIGVTVVQQKCYDAALEELVDNALYDGKSYNQRRPFGGGIAPLERIRAYGKRREISYRC